MMIIKVPNMIIVCLEAEFAMHFLLVTEVCFKAKVKPSISMAFSRFLES